MYLLFFFFFNDTATTEIYTLSLHDALPISGRLCLALSLSALALISSFAPALPGTAPHSAPEYLATANSFPAPDRKSTRLNSSHANISYAVFCLKKKKKIINKYLCQLHRLLS